MINLPTLVRFQGQVPDRATMDREEFAIATYYYLRYINDDFVPSFEEKSEAIETQLNQFSDDMNALKSDTETIKSDTEAIKQQTETIKNDTLTIKQQTESIKNDTQTIKDDTQTLHDETQSFRDTAGQYKDLAKNYANADQNVEVEQGYYSAKHWAMVAQNLANDTEAILPEGSINDNAVASTTTWSSQKLDSYLAKSDISNVAASAILEKVKSVDGAGSGLDADLLDGHEGSYYTNASNISSGTLSADRLPATINSNTTGNAATATKLKTARTIALSGDVSGSASFDGSGNITITTTVQNNASHNHDDRYYTKSQSDGRYLGKTAKAADSDKLDGHDSTQFDRLHHTASANVGGGWITVASTGSGRWYGEIYVMDTDGGDHAFIHLTWMRSYQDSNVSVINVGGYGRRITGVRVLYDTDDNTYGTKYLQIYVTTQSTYEVRIYGKQLRSGWNVPNVVTPVVQNSISGYAIHGEEIHQLENVTIGAQQGFASAGNFYFTGTRSSTNRAHGIVWTAFDKESSGDFSDIGKIIQTTNTQGLSGSVLLIEQLNDASDGVAVHTASNNGFRHNGNIIWTAGNDGAGSGLDADKLDGMQPSTSNSANTIARRDGSGDITARLFRTTYGAQTSAPSANAEFFFRNSSTDNYMRPLSSAAFKDWLNNLGIGVNVDFFGIDIGINHNTNATYTLGFPTNGRIVFVFAAIQEAFDNSKQYDYMYEYFDSWEELPNSYCFMKQSNDVRCKLIYTKGNTTTHYAHTLLLKNEQINIRGGWASGEPTINMKITIVAI